MTFCEQCGDEIGYLPFKCKYCGGVFCKKHRLPENHGCSFELKHSPTVSTLMPRDTVSVKTRPISQEYSYNGPRELKKYLRRQDKQRQRTIKSYDPSRSRKTRYKGTKWLVFLVMIASIVALIFEFYGLPEYVYLSLNGLFFNSFLTFYTFLTALFVAESSIIWIFFLFIMLIFLYMIARNIELVHGTKYLIKLYFICTLFSALFYILLRLALSGVYPIYVSGDYVGLAWGGILGLIAYSIYPIMNREVTSLMMFIPIRMKGRTLLIIIILIRLVPGLLFALISPHYLWVYFPDLGGVLGSYLVYKYQWGTRQR